MTDDANDDKIANFADFIAKTTRPAPKPDSDAPGSLSDIACGKVKRRISEMQKDEHKAAVVLNCLKDIGVTLKYNSFADQLFVNGLNKVNCAAKWDGQLSDAAILEMRWRLDEIKPGFCPATTRLREIVTTEAFQNTYHPVEDYLGSLSWDGAKRIETLFSQYFGAEDSDYIRAISKMFLVAGVARIIEAGCKYDYVVTLIGGQGIGKSSGVAALCPNEKWFSDQFPALAMSSHPGRDCLEHFRGRWIVEWGEMAGLRKSEAEQVKSLLSRQTDRGRPAYAQFSVDCPRQCIIIASTNRDDCLHDETGNRRFLIVRCKQTVLVDDLKRDRDQLWAEAYQCYHNGDRPILDPIHYQAAGKEQEASLDGGPYAEHFTCLQGYAEGIVTAAHAKDFIKGKTDRWDDERGPRLIARALAAYGFKHTRYGPRDNRLNKSASIYVKASFEISMSQLPIIRLEDPASAVLF